MLGEGATLLAEFVDRHRILVLALGAILLLDLPFDRQSVAIPARNVIGVPARHLLRAHHQVLQDLVECRADMDIAIGIGRTVMEDEEVTAFRILPQTGKEIHRLPALEDVRLLLRQARLHREAGLGQEQGFAIVAHRIFGLVVHFGQSILIVRARL